MNTSTESTFEVSVSKALSVSALYMACVLLIELIALFFLETAFPDSFATALVMLVPPVLVFVVAAVFCLMPRCTISHEGMSTTWSIFYQGLLRWEDVTGIETRRIGPFYVILTSNRGEVCVLPRKFLLKKPESLKQLIEQYAPADNIVRKVLAP